MQEKFIVEICNQVFELEKKSKQHAYDRIQQNLNKLKYIVESEGFLLKDPIGEVYDHTRIDCEATILKDKEPFVITETLKPAIYLIENNQPRLIQLARVLIQ